MSDIFSICVNPENVKNIAIDAKPRKQSDCRVDHLQALRNDNRLSLETSEPMSHLAIVALNAVCLSFRLNQEFCGDETFIGLPIIGVVYLHFPVLQTFKKFFQCGFISITTLPCDEFSGITTKRLPDPEFVFFSDSATSHRVQGRQRQSGVPGDVRVDC